MDRRTQWGTVLVVIGIAIGAIAGNDAPTEILVIGGAAIGVGVFLWMLGLMALHGPDRFSLGSSNQEDTTPPSAGQGCVIALCGALLGFFSCLGALFNSGGAIYGVLAAAAFGGLVLLISGIVLAIVRAGRREHPAGGST